MERLLLWSGWDEWRAEAASVVLGDDELTATGTQLGGEPLPYRVDYELEVGGARWVTRRLDVRASGDGWRRAVRLARADDGSWTVEAEAEGDVRLPAPGGDAAALAPALDVDLGNSPLTNFMPARRFELGQRPGAHDLTMAFVRVPDLAVFPHAQRYEHVRPGVVRYASETVDGGGGRFSAELELDADGFVVAYEALARRV